MPWLEFRNDSGEQIPAYGIVRITGLVIPEPGRVILTVGKPNTYGCQFQCAINGPAAVANGKYGTCTRAAFVPALFDTSDGTPGVGERWGPRDATWKLRKQTGGFFVVGTTKVSKGLVLVNPAPMLSFVGKTDAAHSKGVTGTISIYAGSLGSETDTTVNMPGVHNRFADIASGKWVRCDWNHQYGEWELVAAEC